VTAGGLAALAGHVTLANDIWAGAVLVMLVPLSWSVASSLRHGDVGVDVIALLAMAGALVLGEELAGAVIALMLAGGNELEASAGRRARRWAKPICPSASPSRRTSSSAAAPRDRTDGRFRYRAPP
jgi:cation transport ATPase